MDIVTDTTKYDKYDWMIYDVEKSFKAGALYLVALGLFCYSEIAGRDIFYFKNPKSKKSEFKNWKCFNLFVGEYMGYIDLLENNDRVYKNFRDGLCHEYHIKSEGKSGVFVYYDKDSIPKFKIHGIDTTKGIINDQFNKVIILELYLADFKKGIEKFKREVEDNK